MLVPGNTASERVTSVWTCLEHRFMSSVWTCLEHGFMASTKKNDTLALAQSII